jgi:hypothetical protein
LAHEQQAALPGGCEQATGALGEHAKTKAKENMRPGAKWAKQLPQRSSN